MTKKKTLKPGNIIKLSILQIALIVMCIVWLIPIFWIFIQSFRAHPNHLGVTEFFPNYWTFQNYILLFTDLDSGMLFGQWFLNTLIIAVITAVMSTLFVLSIAYVLSRFQFRFRRPYMNLALILGMFPGFLTIIAIGSLFQELGMIGGGWFFLTLPLVYSSGAGLGFFISKGFFDTISKTLDEAARIDGASNARIFFQIILPLSKPIVVFVILTSFLGPWGDFLFAGFILRNETEFQTVAVGLFAILTGDGTSHLFVRFAASAVLIAIPIASLFIFLQRYYVSGVTGGAVKG